MSGFFKTNREIFSHPIWHNILQFRLFFLIYGNAVHSKEGFRQTETLTLKRGQWQRSYDKLIDDLKYKENNTWKKYSKTTLQRNIKVMELNGLLSTSQHELGTIFTVVNYEKYQGFQEFSKNDLEPDLEQQRNSNGTVTEQQRNHNNNVNNDNNEKKEDNKEIVVAKATTKLSIYDSFNFDDYNFSQDVLNSIHDYYKHRQTTKHKMSEVSLKRLCNKLKREFNCEQDILDAIDTSIVKDYRDVFPPNEKNNKTKQDSLSELRKKMLGNEVIDVTPDILRIEVGENYE